MITDKLGDQDYIDLNIASRLGLIVRFVLGQKNDWKRLELMSGIKAVRWRHFYSGATKPSADMLEYFFRTYPEHALWLATGNTDEAAGHTAPRLTLALKLPNTQELPLIPAFTLKAMGSHPEAPTNEQQQALARLIDVAKRDTGQSRRVAEFLLAWWNASDYGGFDLTSLWSVDLAIARDMQAVFGLIAEHHHYPDHYSLADDFQEIVKQWRPENQD